jgi:hypothetical protein
LFDCVGGRNLMLRGCLGDFSVLLVAFMMHRHPRYITHS